MRDLHQIKLIMESLNKEKDKYLYELAKLNASIKNKKSLIVKMLSYRNDYFNKDNLHFSKSVPGLHHNIDLFIKKMSLDISQAESEITSLLHVRDSILITIGKITKKIDLMNIFESKSKIELQRIDDKREQAVLDDIYSTMAQRGENE